MPDPNASTWTEKLEPKWPRRDRANVVHNFPWALQEQCRLVAQSPSHLQSHLAVAPDSSQARPSISKGTPTFANPGLACNGRHTDRDRGVDLSRLKADPRKLTFRFPRPDPNSSTWTERLEPNMAMGDRANFVHNFPRALQQQCRLGAQAPSHQQSQPLVAPDSSQATDPASPKAHQLLHRSRQRWIVRI